MELNFEGVGISQMPTDRLTQSFHEMIAEYKKRGLNALDHLPRWEMASRKLLTGKQEDAVKYALANLPDCPAERKLRTAFPEALEREAHHG